jgi:PAS domain S-box-containing protein
MTTTIVDFLDVLPGLLWLARPNGHVDIVSRYWRESTGLDTSHSTGSQWQQAVHPESLPAVQDCWRLALDSGEPRDVDARLRCTKGHYRWFCIRFFPVTDARNGSLCWCGMGLDIDDRVRALERCEALLAKAQTLSSSGSFTWRTSTDEITWSEQVYRLFEIDPATVVTLDLIGAHHLPEDLPLVADMVKKARAGEDWEYEHRLLMKDGTIKYLHTVAHATRSKDGQIEYIGAVHDVTRDRLSEEALNKARSELAHVARVSSLGALTASIAHEVNQPLAGIVTNTNTCLRMLGANPPNLDGALETARRTLRDANRASDVIVRLRAMFSRTPGVTELLDLNAAASEVIALSRSELQRGRVLVRQHLDPDLPQVFGDRIQLQQVILNLLLNATQAMRDVEDRPRVVQIRTEREAVDRVRLSVQDAGIGIDPRNIEQLFDAFFTTKDGGMGIGLSVSRTIVESHNGRLWASRNDGPGATFAFSIPCDEVATEPMPQSYSHAGQTSDANI